MVTVKLKHFQKYFPEKKVKTEGNNDGTKTERGQEEKGEPNTCVTENGQNKPRITKYDVGISGSHSIIKSFIALVQLYSIIRMLRAADLEDYGAYQLTAIPYGLMSFVNIVSGFVTPSYPTVYMVSSTVMKDAEERGGVFDGVIGELDEDKTEAKPIDPTIQYMDQETTLRTISNGRLSPEDRSLFRLREYFYHLGKSIPLLRLSRKPPKINSYQNFQEIYTEAKKNNLNLNCFFILGIGNPKWRPSAYKWMPLVTDVLMIIALALPFVIIYLLTGFKTPITTWHGIVFMLWLAIGDMMPFLSTASWNFIAMKVSRTLMIKAILRGFLITSIFSPAALVGYVLVGKLRYEELAAHNHNCSKSWTDNHRALYAHHLL